MSNIVIIDYNTGNVGSLLNMFKRLGIKAILSKEVDDIINADKLILGGVGAFDAGMRNLKRADLIVLLEKLVLEDRKPILGICLGMQLMTKESEEGVLKGLGWIDAKTIKFNSAEFDNKLLKVPHMGWNTVIPVTSISEEIFCGARFYFVHSHHVVCHDPKDILTLTEYGIRFVSSIRHENIWGVQFHPEKSHKFGKRFLSYFAEVG